jgi:hypothetical protein
MAATVFPLPDGSNFVATKRHVPETPPFGAFGDDETALIAWASEKWNLLFQLKRGETEQLKACESFYSGHHYLDPWDNRQNPVTNYCFSSVETVWPILTEVRPRPEAVPRRWMDADRIQRINNFATYKMDTCGFDRIFRISVRDLLKFGWCCPMIGWDSKGTAIPKYLSPFDFYPDGATEESEMECFAIARPASVRRLRALFPKVADRIHPDNIASPSYEVMVQPYLEESGLGGRINMPQIMGTMPSTIMEGDDAAVTSGHYVVDTGSFQTFGQSAFLVQLFVRDYTTMSVRYVGNRLIDHETGQLTVPHSMTKQESCCPSGWRMIPFLANGVLLDKPRPVDPSLSGIPLVIGRDYEQGGRFFARGELHDIIPIQRDINRSDALIARALELQANPPVKVSNDARISVDRSSVEGGELIRIARGAMMEYLQPNGVSESHFERRALRRQDIQIVGGTPDSLQGQRPVGVEAASAIRQLTESAATRARAKGTGLLEWAALLLQKMMRADAMKSRETIYYKGTDGRDMWMNPADLTPEDWDIRWATSSGTAQARQDRIDLDKELLQMGVIDPQQLLEDLDYPNRGAILQRVGMQRMLAEQQAAASAEGGGPKK